MTVIYALCVPILMCVTGGALGVAKYSKQYNSLKHIAEFAAMTGAKEMTLANATAADIKAVAEAYIESSILAEFGDMEYTKLATVDMNEATVKVDLSLTVQGLLGQSFFPENGYIEASSTAIAQASMKLCALTLNETDTHSLNLVDKSVITADDCALYANSNDYNAVGIAKDAEVTANTVCAVGGIEDLSSSTTADLITDCPKLDDPLAGRTAPDDSTCDFLNISLLDTLLATEITMDPGVYCGGFRVLKKIKVTLNPGIYVMKDGPLQIDKKGELYGEDVAFYMSGPGSVFQFEKDSIIELAAPRTGSMAGLLFMDDAANPGQEHQILSEDARKFLGTIYIPNSKLTIDTTKKVGEASAYTVIVADTMELLNNPTLFLNSDYSATDVPVPDGLGPIDGTPRLLR